MVRERIIYTPSPEEAAVSERQELADIEETKVDQVLEREPLEQELMQEGASEAGEQIEDVQSDRKGE